LRSPNFDKNCNNLLLYFAKLPLKLDNYDPKLAGTRVKKNSSSSFLESNTRQYLSTRSSPTYRNDA